MERVALIAFCLAVLLCGFRANAAEEAVYPGAQETRIDGELLVDGRPTGAALFRTDDEPKAVIVFFRARLEGQPVDLVEVPIEDGLLLAALDHRSGLHLVISARRNGEGETEVVRGWSGPPEASAPPDEGLPLPPELVMVSRIDDRAGGMRVSTRLGFASVSPDELASALATALARAGWSRSKRGPGAAWRQGHRELHTTIGGDGEGSRIELRLLEREGR